MDRQYRQQVAEDPANALEGHQLPESDRAIMGRKEFAEVARESATEQTRNGIWGWVDDDLAFLSPWGFDPATIAVPVQVWYGTQDVLTPPRHGKWIASTVPEAIVRLNKLGHLGNPDSDVVERLRWLTGSRA